MHKGCWRRLGRGFKKGTRFGGCLPREKGRSAGQAPSGSGSFSSGWCPLWASEGVGFGQTSCRRTPQSGQTDGGGWRYLTCPESGLSLPLFTAPSPSPSPAHTPPSARSPAPPPAPPSAPPTPPPQAPCSPAVPPRCPRRAPHRR